MQTMEQRLEGIQNRPATYFETITVALGKRTVTLEHFNDAVFRIGRGPENHLRIDDLNIGLRQAQIEIGPAGVWFRNRDAQKTDSFISRDQEIQASSSLLTLAEGQDLMVRSDGKGHLMIALLAEDMGHRQGPNTLRQYWIRSGFRPLSADDQNEEFGLTYFATPHGDQTILTHVVWRGARPGQSPDWEGVVIPELRESAGTTRSL